MARRKVGEQNTRSLGKIGNGSYMVTIPIAHIRELKWQDNQKVVVELDRKAKRLIIRDWSVRAGGKKIVLLMPDLHKKETEKPKVLLVVTRAGIGGAQQRIFNLALALKEEVDVSVGYGEGDTLPHKLEKMGIKSYQLHYLERSHNPWSIYLFIKEIKALCRTEGFQAVHLNSSNTLPGALGVKLARSDIRTVFTFRGLSLLDPGYEASWLLKLIYRSFFKIFLRWVDVGVFQCEANRKEARDQGILSRATVVIEEGIALQPIIEADREVALAKLEELAGASLSGKVIMGTVARLSAEKNQEFLIKALSKLQSISPDFVFFFIGDGPLRSVLEAKVMELRLEHQVFFVGEIVGAASLLKGLDIFVLTSKYEGLSVSVTEAIASEIVVVASDVGCMSSLLPLDDIRYVAGDEAGLVVKLDRFMKDPELRREVAGVLREHSLKFDFRRSAKEYTDAYFDQIQDKSTSDGS